VGTDLTETVSLGKLLILDLDETLIFATERPLTREADFRIGPYHVYRRPDLADFLDQCF